MKTNLIAVMFLSLVAIFLTSCSTTTETTTTTTTTEDTRMQKSRYAH